MCNIMFGPLTILASLIAAISAGYAGSSSNSVGNGNGYGYSGSFSGGGGGNIPQFAQVPGFDFGAFGAQFESLQQYHQQFLANGAPYSYSIASSSPNSNAQAQSSITFSGLQQQILQASGGQGGIPAYTPSSGVGGGGSAYGGGYGGSFSGTDGGAVASGSIGPNGYQQTAAVYPENPNNPNIFSRFGGGGGGNGGNYGVFTSSVSSSSNRNGKPQNFHQASTTINDNGKISTYTVKNP